jgi:hypothetical protein
LRLSRRVAAIAIGTWAALGAVPPPPLEAGISPYDDCYREDKDNYIDIVIAGQAAAVRRITSVEIPASGAYSPFFNPRGPGNSPTSGVPYTSPGPSQLEPVRVALDNPLAVTFVRAARCAQQRPPAGARR